MSTSTIDGIMRRDADRLAVRFERTYATDAEDLWDAVTRPERLGRWLMPVTGDLRVGGRYRLHVPDDERAGGEILRCEAPRELDVTWEFGDEVVSRLEVRVRPAGEAAVLLLDHSRLPQDQGAGYGAGWQTYLEALDAFLTGTRAAEWDARWSQLVPGYKQVLADLG